MKHKKKCKLQNSKGLKVKFNPAEIKEIHMIETTITNKQKVEGTIVIPNKPDGTPAQIQGIPNWSVQSGDSTVVAAADGLSAFLVSSDTNGDTVYSLTALVDFGTGFVPTQTQITLHVSDVASQTLDVSFSAPVNK